MAETHTEALAEGMERNTSRPYCVTAQVSQGKIKGRIALVAGFDTMEEAQWAAERLQKFFGIGTAEAGHQ